MDEPRLDQLPDDADPGTGAMTPSVDGEVTESGVPEMDDGPQRHGTGIDEIPGDSPWDIERQGDSQRRF